MNQKINPQLLINFSELIKQFYTNKSVELENLNVKNVHSKLLHFLSDHNGLNQKEIADFAGVGRSTMSETITEMVHEGYVERRSLKGDKKRQFIFLTPDGAALADKIKALFDDYCERCLRDFSEEEVMELERLLAKFHF